MRIGQGVDVHRFSETPRALWLGLVEVAEGPGLAGHSDADVATHALCDALLGAANLGDLGRHFPSSDPNFQDVASRDLLTSTLALVETAGFAVLSGDVTIMCERPHLANYLERMSDQLSGLLGATISVKATTFDGLGALGRAEGIGASAVVLIEDRP